MLKIAIALRTRPEPFDLADYARQTATEYPPYMPRTPSTRLPKLPALVEQKLTKTGYTRGATTKEIFQNRVTRNNPVLIDLEYWEQCREPDDGTQDYENGFIVLVEPSWYFGTSDAAEQLASRGLSLGVNALLLYRRRSDWVTYGPPSGREMQAATSRLAPLGGTYFARVHATVSSDGNMIIEGFNTTALRGAGIRVYEYASKQTINHAKLQLEALLWMCEGSVASMVEAGMSLEDATVRRERQLERAAAQSLLDERRLRELRMIDAVGHTVCPLCFERINAGLFLKRSEQAVGRETYDLTTTEVSLFHIEELRVGRLQHKPYNLGWGHHFCNVVVKDAGIAPTLTWMERVLANQLETGLDGESG